MRASARFCASLPVLGRRPRSQVGLTRSVAFLATVTLDLPTDRGRRSAELRCYRAWPSSSGRSAESAARNVLSVHERRAGVGSRAWRTASPCWRNAAANGHGVVRVSHCSKRRPEHLVRDLDQGIHLGHLVTAPSHRSCHLLLKATRGVTIALVSSRERKRRQPGLATDDPAFVGWHQLVRGIQGS